VARVCEYWGRANQRRSASGAGGPQPNAHHRFLQVALFPLPYQWAPHMTVAEAILAMVRIWAWIGAAVAAVFLTVGMDRVDPNARGAYVFRPLLIPAILLIWPLVLWRWFVLETGRDRWHRQYSPPRKAHMAVAWALAVAIPVIFATGLSLRQTWPADIAPERLAAPAEVAQ